MKKLLLTLALLLAPSLAWGQCNGVFPANTVCGTVLGGAPGSVAALAPISALNNIWTGRQTFNYTPVFDLASGVLGVNELFTATNITVPAGKAYSDIRFSQPNGASNTYTIGAGSIVVPIYSFPTMLAGSDAASTLYAGVFQITNAGPGITKGIHGGCFGSGASTGSCIAMNLQLQPVATMSYVSGGFASLTSSGINNLAIAYGIESNGDQYLCAMCNTVSALPIGTDYIRWWQSGTSAAGANFLNLLDTNGSTTLFKVTKAGAVTGASFTAGAAAGLTVTKTVRAAGGAADCTLIFTGGLLTGGSC